MVGYDHGAKFQTFIKVALFQKVFPSSKKVTNSSSLKILRIVICHIFGGWRQSEKLLSEIKVPLSDNESFF